MGKPRRSLRKIESRSIAEFMVDTISDELSVLSSSDLTWVSNEMVEMMSRAKLSKEAKVIMNTLVFLLRATDEVRRDPEFIPPKLPQIFPRCGPARTKGSRAR